MSKFRVAAAQCKNKALQKKPGAPLANRSAPGFLSRYHWRFLAHYWWSLLKKPGTSLVNQPTPGLFSRFFQNIKKIFFSYCANNISNLANQPAPGIFSCHWWNLLKKSGVPLVNQPIPGLFSRFFQNIYKNKFTYCAYNISNPANQPAPGVFSSHWWNLLKKPGAPLVNQPAPCIFSSHWWNLLKKTRCPFENQPAPLLKNPGADQFVWRTSQKILGNQAFIRGCGGESPARVSEH